MQRLPASVAASTVLHRSPFAFAHNRQSRAVDDEMDGSSRWDAAEFNRERLTSSGERGVVGGCEIDTHQRQDRPQEAFRLAQGQPEDKAERQRRLDRTVRERLRRAWSTGRRRRHASVASAESHSVTSPRWTKACSYADQCPTRYFVLYFGWTFDLMSRSCTRSGHRGQRADSCLVAAKGLCTNACAGKARSRGTRCRDVIFETLFETLWVSNPIRPRSAASRNRVMRGPGVTQGAKRSQGARRPRN